MWTSRPVWLKMGLISPWACWNRNIFCSLGLLSLLWLMYVFQLQGYYWMARWTTHRTQANSSLTMSSQSACNNIVPQTPLQTHHLFTPRSPQLACVAMAPAVTRTLAPRPGNVVTMPTTVVSKRNAYRPVTMISTSHENPEELKKNK